MGRKGFLFIGAIVCLLLLGEQARGMISKDVDYNVPIPVERMFPCGNFEVYVERGGSMQYAGMLEFDRYFRSRSLDLRSFLDGREESTVVVVQKGGGTAQVDSVFLGDAPPTNTGDFAEGQKLALRDFDVMDALGKTLRLEFPAVSGPAALSLTARVEPEEPFGSPFMFPEENLMKPVGMDSEFYRYERTQGPPASTMEGEPFFKVYCRAATGHPDGFAYGWVWNDDDNLYATVDFTGDNTMDGLKDFSELFVRTSNGVERFRVSVGDTEWGYPEFAYTDRVDWQHKVYHFAVPFEKIGNPDGPLEIAFSAYGTAAAAYATIEIADSPDPVTAGSGTGNLVHTIRVTNTYTLDTDAITVALDLDLPSGVTVDDIDPTQGTITGTSPDFQWEVGRLDRRGEFADLTVTLTVDSSTAAGTDVIGDTATITYIFFNDGPEVNDPGISDTEATSVEKAVDIQVTKTDSPDPVTAGSGTGNLVYTVTVANNGPSDATGLVIAEAPTLPSGVSLDSADPSVGTCPSPYGTWTIGDLASGDDATLTLTLTVDSSADDADVIENQAGVSGLNESDSDSTNDSATETTNIVNSVDIAVTKTDSPDPVTAGSGTGNLVYTVTVVNNGPSDATGLVIAEAPSLPSGVSLDSADPSVGTCPSPYGTWTIGDLASGDDATLTLTLTVDASASEGVNTIRNTASVDAVDQADSDSSNDSATEATSVAQLVDLAVTKTESADPVIAGSGTGNLTYVVTVTNNGPSVSRDVVVAESMTLPQGVSLDSATPSKGAFDDPTWNVGDLDIDESATLTIVLTVGPSAVAGTDVIGNTATASSSATAVTRASETDPGNNSATISTSIERRVDLSVTKTESADPVEAGSGDGNLTYVVTLANSGPSDASGVEVSEALTLPAGVSVASTTPSTGSFDGSVWNVGDLAVGDDASLTVVLTVGPSAVSGTDVVGDTATVVSVNEPDTDSGNDSATEMTSVEGADVDPIPSVGHWGVAALMAAMALAGLRFLWRRGKQE